MLYALLGLYGRINLCGGGGWSKNQYRQGGSKYEVETYLQQLQDLNQAFFFLQSQDSAPSLWRLGSDYVGLQSVDWMANVNAGQNEKTSSLQAQSDQIVIV